MGEAAPGSEFAAGLRSATPSQPGDVCGWAGDVAAYALGALDPDGDLAVEGHIAACDACANDLEWMVSVVTALDDAVSLGLVDAETMTPNDGRTDRRDPHKARIA